MLWNFKSCVILLTRRLYFYPHRKDILSAYKESMNNMLWLFTECFNSALKENDFKDVRTHITRLLGIT